MSWTIFQRGSPVPGGQLGETFEDGVRVGNVLVGQIRVQRAGVDPARQAGQGEQALQLAGEQQPPRLVPVD
jgi:hypothetical protein